MENISFDAVNLVSIGSRVLGCRAKQTCYFNEY